MFHTDRTVIVEGRYDKLRLAALTDALIITTEGFGIFNDREKQQLIKALAHKNGLLILTDSDRAGFQIRAYIRNIVGSADVINAYIPDVFGKEKRKDTASREGKLGVEGMSTEALMEALRRSGLFTESDKTAPRRLITNADLYLAGLTGKENSAIKRRALLTEAGLPARLSGGSLLKLLNTFLTYEDFLRLTAEL